MTDASSAAAGAQVKTFCSICAGMCGLVVTLDAQGKVLGIRGDRDNPLTAGYACIKGLLLPEAHSSPNRLLRPLRRRTDGSFEEVEPEQALDEIAAILGRIRARDGSDAIAAFRGTLGYSNYMLPAWVRAIGSHGFYSTMTIDQSAKWVTFERLGGWAGGREPFATADVTMMVGANPLVSLSTFNFHNQHPVNAVRAAKQRGMKLIVIDPRRTETTRYADIHLQPLPGEDPSLLAGLLNIILEEGWHDAAFCAAHANGLEALRLAVAAYTPDYVAARAGVDARVLRAAAEMFARTEPGRRRRGTAASGVGPNMSPHSNLAEHLVESLNVVCGRYPRSGDPVPNPGVIGARRPQLAQAISPRRSWEQGYRSRVGGYGMLFGEMMSGALCEEILASGPGQVKALIVDAGNPANAFPDQEKTVRALRSLELLVAIEPFMTNTARLAHYILPPPMLLERPALPPRDYETIVLPLPYSQYSPAVLQPPPGSALLDPNFVFWALAQRMGVAIDFDGVPLDMTRAPDNDELLGILARHSQVPFEEIRRHEGGKIHAVEPQFVGQADPATAGRFELMPPDVADELKTVLDEPRPAPEYTHRLAVRRMRDVQNTMYRDLPLIRERHPYNPAYLHPDDLRSLGLEDGTEVRIASPTGSIPAIVAADESVRPGVVSMTHGWGGMPGEPEDYRRNGASTNRLTSSEADLDPINAMPVLSALPVRVDRRKP